MKPTVNRIRKKELGFAYIFAYLITETPLKK